MIDAKPDETVLKSNNPLNHAHVPVTKSFNNFVTLSVISPNDTSPVNNPLIKSKPLLIKSFTLSTNTFIDCSTVAPKSNPK